VRSGPFVYAGACLADLINTPELVPAAVMAMLVPLMRTPAAADHTAGHDLAAPVDPHQHAAVTNASGHGSRAAPADLLDGLRRILDAAEHGRCSSRCSRSCSGGPSSR